ncbi:hypothetical protein HanXRQr2_Chr01g0036191 [Helianthus annuus]|uniref:Uncharacterized protein n=1 Tax=Helianthus annuus TaxID=4232 RepID=A0A9K3P5I5_HELAN|nr:hypothetical protein HanXRQr2_Chr01g0036191 [Helianthus annuus]
MCARCGHSHLRMGLGCPVYLTARITLNVTYCIKGIQDHRGNKM